MANSRKRCKHCREYKPAKDGVQTPKGWFCELLHAVEYARLNSHKGKAIKDRAFKQKKREHRANDYSKQFDLTKKAAQQLANLLDRDLVCISCSCQRTVQFCGGHFRTVGAHRELALDLRNIHGQCNRNCNMGLSGNVGGTKNTKGFRAGLIERYGSGMVDYLERHHPSKQYTCPDLIELRRSYNLEIRNLRRGEPPSRDWRAIEEKHGD